MAWEMWRYYQTLTICYKTLAEVTLAKRLQRPKERILEFFDGRFWLQVPFFLVGVAGLGVYKLRKPLAALVGLDVTLKKLKHVEIIHDPTTQVPVRVKKSTDTGEKPESLTDKWISQLSSQARYLDTRRVLLLWYVLEELIHLPITYRYYRLEFDSAYQNVKDDTRRFLYNNVKAAGAVPRDLYLEVRVFQMQRKLTRQGLLEDTGAHHWIQLGRKATMALTDKKDNIISKYQQTKMSITTLAPIYYPAIEKFATTLKRLTTRKPKKEEPIQIIAEPMSPVPALAPSLECGEKLGLSVRTCLALLETSSKFAPHAEKAKTSLAASLEKYGPKFDHTLPFFKRDKKQQTEVFVEDPAEELDDIDD